MRGKATGADKTQAGEHKRVNTSRRGVATNTTEKGAGRPLTPRPWCSNPATPPDTPGPGGLVA